MGQKVNPISMRLGYVQGWKSKWFSRRNFRTYLEQDFRLRKIISKKLKEAAVAKIEIERSPRGILFSIHTPRPGIIIGKGGAGVEDLKKELAQETEKLSGKKLEIKVNIEEVKDPLGNAAVIARGIAEQLEKRVPFKRVLKQAIERSKDSVGVKGIKIMVAGRLNGAEMSRREHLVQGSIPLHTIRANIDFAKDVAQTTYGIIGIKVWVYKGQVFKDKIVEQEVPQTTRK